MYKFVLKCTNLYNLARTLQSGDVQMSLHDDITIQLTGLHSWTLVLMVVDYSLAWKTEIQNNRRNISKWRDHLPQVSISLTDFYTHCQQSANHYTFAKGLMKD